MSPEPKVVITDRPPEAVHVRDRFERVAVKDYLTLLRRGGTPVAIVYRAPSGEIEVAAQSSAFSSIASVFEIMQEAAAKISAAFFRSGKKAVRN